MCRSDGSHYEKRIDAKGHILSDECIDDEIPFEIPESWEWVRVEVLGDWKAGATPAKSQPKYHTNGNIPWLLTGDLNDSVVRNIPNKITQQALDECSLRLNPVGSVLVAMYGATIGKIGVLGIPSTTNQACCACILHIDEVRDWLVTWLFFYRPYFVKLGEGGAQPNISREKIVSQLIPIPPLSEQHRITEKISTLLPLIEEYGKFEDARETLDAELPERLRKSILQQAVQGKLVPQDPTDEPASVLLERIRAERAKLIAEKKIKAPKGGESIIYRRSDGSHYEKRIDAKGRVLSDECIEDEIPFEIPDSWEWVRLKETSTLKSGFAFKAHEYVDAGLQVVRISDLQENSISNKDAVYYPADSLLSKYLIEKNSILICMTGSIGKMAWVLEETPRYLNQRVGMLVCAQNITPYVWLFLHTVYVLNTWLSAKTSTNGNIKNTDIEELLVPLPPLSEQYRIVERITILQDLLTNQ